MGKVRAALIVLGVIFLLPSITPEKAHSEVDVHIGIGLPALVISSPPVMVVIPGTYVYYSPDISAEIFFYHGYWYRPYGGIWYRATIYNGPWARIGAPPAVVVNVPKNYRSIPPGHQGVPWGQVKQNWRTWEKEKHWDKPGPKGGGGPEMKGSKMKGGGGPEMKEPKGGPEMKEMKGGKGPGKGGKGKGKED